TAKAAAVDVGVWYEFGFGGPGSSLGDCSGCTPTVPGSIDAGDGPWTFTPTNPGTLTVLDLFQSVDQFELFNFGAFLGQTSVPTSGSDVGGNIAAALANLDFSRGIFNLLPGNYSITGAQL